MDKTQAGYNELSDVRITRVGLCKSPAVPEATHVLMKSKDADAEVDAESSQTRLPSGANSDEQSVDAQTITKIAEDLVSGITGMIAKAFGKKPEAAVEKTATTESVNDMDISKATAADIEKANPELYKAIVAKALEGVKDSRGERVGDAAPTDGKLKDSDGCDADNAVTLPDLGERVADAKNVGSHVEGAVESRQPTQQMKPKDDSQSGGVDFSHMSKADAEELKKSFLDVKASLDRLTKFDTSRPGEAARKKEELAAVKETQDACDHTDESNGGTVEAAGKSTRSAGQITKIDTSRPGEKAIDASKEAAVTATANAIDKERKANDSGIGAIKTNDGEAAKDDALQAELATLKTQVGTLEKALADAGVEKARVENLEKAMAKMIREGATVAKTDEVAKAQTEPVVKARSQQAGQLDDKSARAETVRKNVFGGAISTIAMAQRNR